MSTSVVRTTFMLWFDDSGRSFEEKAKIAARYYKHKYGVAPNVFEPCKPAHHFKVKYVPNLTTADSVV